MDPNNPPTNPPGGQSGASGDLYGQRPSWEQQYGQPATETQTPAQPVQRPQEQPRNQPYGQPYAQQPGQPYPPQGYAPGQPPPGQPRGPQPGGQPYPGGPPGAFDHALVTAAFELPGHTIVRNFGMVRGIIVRSRSIFGQIGAGFQQLAGGNISIYTEMCERARQDAYEIMIQHAAALGANAIIGARYDATEITSGVTEVLCYGTAVTVVPTRAG
jgi:uncharacterized protein YbjQ (UPF0145 family)